MDIAKLEVPLNRNRLHMLVLRNIFVLYFLSICSVPAQHRPTPLDRIGQPIVTTFSARQYKAHPTNFAVVQDDQGILYFGNLWCVLQFDGTLWRQIYLPGGASCSALALDTDGTIYVGGRNAIGYLKTDATGRKFYVSLREELPAQENKFNEIWKIAVSPEGIFFSSYERLFFRSRKTGTMRAIRTAPWYVFHALGKTYITDKSGLHHFVNDTIQKVPNSEYFDNKFINAITHLDERLLVCTSEEGIFVFDGQKVKRWDTPINNVIRQFNPTKIENIRNSHLVISTELNGVFITDLQGNIVAHFNKSNGLTANTVSSFFLDQSNMLWLATYNGIALVPIFRQVSYINDYNGVSGIPYSSARYDNKLYLATSEGLFSTPLTSADASPGKFTRVTNGLVWNLQVIDDKLFCGQAITAFTIDHGKIKTIFDEGTWMFAPLNGTTILMCTYGGLHYLKKKNGSWQYEKRLKGFDSPGRTFAIDKMGDVWVSGDHGSLRRLRLTSSGDSVKQTKIFTGAGSHSFKYSSTVLRFHDDMLFTTTAGICYYDYNLESLMLEKSLNAVLAKHGFQNAKKIIPDIPDHLRVVTSEGSIVKVRYTAQGSALQESTERVRGKLITDFEHVNVMDDVITIGTVDGFAVYKADAAQPELPFSTHISKIETQRRVISNGHCNLKAIAGAIPYAENTMRFTFASNAYEDLNTNQYQYYLEGFEDKKSWSAPTFIPFKEYTNLDPGNYKLHVRAINFEHRVSEERVVAFTILPPWYRAWWSYLIYGVAFVALNAVVFKRVQRRIEHEKKRVAREKQHQLWLKQKEWEEQMLKNRKQVMVLQQEKFEIERAALQEKEQRMEKEKAHEREIMELEKEKLEADLLHKSNELSSLTLHITQKNEMITRIAGQVAKTIQESNDEAAVKNLLEIKSLLQKGADSSREWQKFIEHFDHVHEGFLKRLKQQHPDLSTTSLKLCAFIRMRLSSKQIATLMNTEPASVLKARYRLRMKFNLTKNTGLEEFLNAF
ncbi:MAG: triple tyrosine motif-containing protein [Bacteroidota bacterium]